MALPSSPPLLPELDDLDVPTSPLLPSEEAAELPLRPRGCPNLKRQFSDYYGSLSSDPLFSEGPSDVDEDDGGDRRRRKKIFKGPWFNLRRASTRSLRRSMARRERMRNADSGIFMGSDESEYSFGERSSSPARGADTDVEEEELRSDSTTSARKPPMPPTAEQLATKTIQQCLETGHEAVDLSDLGLNRLDDAVLRPLHQLIKHSHSDLTQPPSEDEFTPMIPAIQLYLSGNKLTALPPELFRLTNITVLSLRNNHLSEIPGNIGALSQLKEFNVAQNNIRWLPWEMLDLLHCRGPHRQISVRPNPLVDPIPDLLGPSPLPRPSFSTGEFKEHLSRWGETNGAFFHQMKQWYSEEGVQWTMRHELELRLKLGRLRLNRYVTEASRSGVELQQCNEQLIYVASSAVQYFDVNGSPCRTLDPKRSDESFAAVVDPFEHAPTSSDASPVPSLYELALRSVQRNFAPPDFHDLHGHFPSSIVGALRQAFTAADYGNSCCAVCSRSFIIARAQWIEYWFNGFPAQEHLTRETLLPFRRSACSWACAAPSEVGAFRF